MRRINQFKLRIIITIVFLIILTTKGLEAKTNQSNITNAGFLTKEDLINKIKERRKRPTMTPTPTFLPTPSLTPTPTYTPTPTPRLIPHGKRGFSVSGGKKGGPQMSSGYIDPYDPNIEEVQKIGIRIKHNQPVTSVSVAMKTDHGIKVVPMMLTSGTDMDGLWEGEWIAQDTYLYTYHAVIEAKSSNGSTTVDITLR